MVLVLPIHILAGSLGLVTGFVALFAAKGAAVHRRVGMAFVVAMLTMTSTGIVVALVRGAGPMLNVPAGLITAYLVVTSLATVRPAPRALLVGAMAVGFAVGAFASACFVLAVTNGGKFAGLPAFPYGMFGVLGIAGGAGDLRLLRAAAPLRGAVRINRHLWRMTVALFIAAMSFFLGQQKVMPAALRIQPLLVLPPLTVLGAMLYWVWRVRLRRLVPSFGARAVPR